MANFGPKPWKNVHFSRFRTSCFYSLKRRFLLLEYHKTNFSGLYCLKEKGGNNAQFWNQNHGLTPLEKCQFFDFLNSLFFSLERLFPF